MFSAIQEGNLNVNPWSEAFCKVQETFSWTGEKNDIGWLLNLDKVQLDFCNSEWQIALTESSFEYVYFII